jgi:alanine racemase
MKAGKYTIQDIAQIIEGKIVGTPPAAHIHYLVTDSRKIIFPGSSVFFALKGPQHDGHLFITKAMEAGVQVFVVSEEKWIIPATGCFILVKNTTEALQKLAGYHRHQFQIPVIGITGSNGKTIVKDWLSFVMSQQLNVCKNPKSYNSQIGVPLSVWNLQAEHEVGIFEAGISQPGEMQKLEPVISPTIGIFTNIGSAHEENFSGIEEKIKEKLQLFKHSSTLIVRNDDPMIEHAAKKIFPTIELITWGTNTTSTYQVNFKKQKTNTDIFITSGDENFSFTIPYSDPASVENAVHAFIAADVLKADMLRVAEQMKFLPQVNMRLSFKQGKNNCFIIDDTYSNDFDSLKIAIDSLHGLQQYANKTIILSDIVQTKGNTEMLYREISDIIRQKNITRVIGIGKEISEYATFFPQGSLFFVDVHALIHQLHTISFNHEAILVKGARVFELEKMVSRLESRHHDTVLEVNLNAMVHNLNYYRNRIPAGTKIMAMVKASGYGTGTHEIAHVLNFHHVHYLAVAYADEGIELRNHGIELPIMVMNAEETNVDLLVEKKLEPVIYHFETLFQLLDHKKNGGKIPPIHIEIDSGMHRLGFDPKKINELIEVLIKEKNIQVNSVFSHLAASDEPAMDSFTREQIQVFKEVAEKIEHAIGTPVIKHIANSAGASRFKEAAFDMIRLGVGLYGVGVDADEQAKLEPVISLFSTVAQITQVKKGESVGYGRSFIAEKEMTIGTVPIGYADGYRRSLGNGKGKMFVNGEPALVIGRVCMDMTMIDISGLNVEVGDRVEIIGENQPIETFAKSMDTIPYEVLTSVSQRVRRIYTQE